ncbi:MAG: CPBP family intramembrane metalloprotease domain-containing protein [Flavobacteriaceae bacterium]|uniref:CPBP family intramembrane glutamic endopeptidase n=1 Tax=Winogradskyella poriferorum TaxID=307627 RepID=UPI000C8F328F|nr:CPBP family intramembrane metalloprotease domain-containing protein [Flavobacteriaceae bacterium]|tara:strand:- start:278 stop:1222 length:945 start_codon:yes stop_codon:yes gene_type:complete
MRLNYIQQAYKGQREIWMFILTTVLVAGIFLLNFVFYLITDPSDMEAAYEMMKDIPSSLNLAINLIPFAFLLGLLFVLVKYVHQRSILSLTTARRKVDYGRVFFAFMMIAVFTIVSFIVSYNIDASEIVYQFDFKKFSILFLVSIVLFPFQIGLEEYLFRGYFMQYIGVYVKNKWFPLILTSVLFGIAHSANPEVTNVGFWKMMIFYIGTGLLLGIMTLMDDGLELALGFHLGNNLLASLLVTADWTALQTDAIFKSTAEPSMSIVGEILIPVLVVYPIMLLILSKKYGWKNWQERLFGKVYEPPKEDYKIIGE